MMTLKVLNPTEEGDAEGVGGGRMTTVFLYTPSRMLQKLEQARFNLAECRTFDEVKKIRDIAEAAKVYAKAAHLSQEAQNYAAEVALLAVHRAGGILNQLGRGKPGVKLPAAIAGNSEYRSIIEESNVPERTAERWQRLSEIPESTVHKYIKEAKEAGVAITQNRLVAEWQQPKVATSPSKTKGEHITALVARISRLEGALTQIVSLRHQFSSSELRQLAVACREAKLQLGKIADDLES